MVVTEPKKRSVLRTELTPEEALKKKLEIRERIKESVKFDKRRKSTDGKAGKKAFLNPERKKKLKKLLFEHATGLVKLRQEEHAHERREALDKAIGKEQHSKVQDEKALRELCKQYHDRIRSLAEEVYELEVGVRTKDYLINELTIQVNHLHGKFIKPSLKKVGSMRASKIEKTEIFNDFRKVLRPAAAPAKNSEEDKPTTPK